MTKPLIIAHRGGAALAPENTMAAFRAALERGDEAIETDLAQTSDGVVVLLHDDTLARTGGVDRPIWTMRYRELADIDVGRWKGPHFAGERVPTLEELAEICSSDRLTLFLDFKYMSERFSGLAERVAAFAAQFGLDRLRFLSLNHAAMDELRAHLPAAEACYSFGQPFKAAETLSSMDQGLGVAPSLTACSLDLLIQAQEQDRAVYVWTPNSHNQLNACLDAPVRGIITDAPDLARQLREQRRR